MPRVKPVVAKTPKELAEALALPAADAKDDMPPEPPVGGRPSLKRIK